MLANELSAQKAKVGACRIRKYSSVRIMMHASVAVKPMTM